MENILHNVCNNFKDHADVPEWLTERSRKPCPFGLLGSNPSIGVYPKDYKSLNFKIFGAIGTSDLFLGQYYDRRSRTHGVREVD